MVYFKIQIKNFKKLMTSSIMTSSIFSQFYSSSAWILRLKIYDVIKTGKYVLEFSITFQKIKTELKNLFLSAHNWCFSKVLFFTSLLTGSIFLMTSSSFGWRHQLEFFFWVRVMVGNLCTKFDVKRTFRSKVIKGGVKHPPW